jgi:cytochrome c peroxidase
MHIAIALAVFLAAVPAGAQEKEKQSIPPSSSYAPVVDRETFQAVRERMSREKDGLMRRQRALLEQRYDLSDRPSKTLMSGAKKKPVQEGVRARLPAGWTWERLAALAPAEVRERELWPKGFLPLPHANQNEGGMLFPRSHIDEVKRQEGRDLERFDLDHDIPEHFLPAFPPPIFLTTRPDLGDASKGELVTIDNFYRLFNGVLNPKDIEGLRLLVNPFPQQQFNATDDRRSVRPHRGVSCFDCHANGHTNAAAHLVGDIRPQPLRRRIDTPSLRGVNIQRLFGSQRALKTVEDFTEFEQRAAYFDGDPVIGTKKGINILERASQVHFMAEVQNLLDFPPAPKLRWDGSLDPALAAPEELRGEAVFHGKGKCATCHPGPHFTDNTMHDLKVHRFYRPRDVNGRFTEAEGPIKTFPLRGIKDSPPYLHDGRLLTLEDAVEFFNLVLEAKLTPDEKRDLAAYLKAL